MTQFPHSVSMYVVFELDPSSSGYTKWMTATEYLTKWVPRHSDVLSVKVSKFILLNIIHWFGVPDIIN